TVWAVMATGVPLFPFRTEKLSRLAPMVLGAQAPGRVGRRPLPRRAANAALPRFADNCRVQGPAELTDGVVRLRMLRKSDVPIVEACSDPETLRFIPQIPEPYSGRRRADVRRPSGGVLARRRGETDGDCRPRDGRARRCDRASARRGRLDRLLGGTESPRAWCGHTCADPSRAV